MNALGATATLLLGLIVCIGSRHWATTAIILGVCYLTQGQMVDVIFFHFTAIRILLLLGLIRTLAKGEMRALQFGPIDWALIIYSLTLFAVPVIRLGTFDAVVYQLGLLYNIYLSYFVFRILVRNEKDIELILSMLALLIIPLALLMIMESITGRTAFFDFGGFVDEVSVVRDGHVRCQGPFRQAITAGSFGATLGLLYVGLIFATKDNRKKFYAGLGASLAILITAHSSGPLLGFALGLMALALWRFRLHTRIFRWGLVGALIGLQFVMKDPVWFILARLGDLVGGGGYHRAYLIDRFINDYAAWFLIGSDDTSSWFPYQLYTGKADITNQFVADGLNGGILGLILSVALAVRCYQQLGTALKKARIQSLDKEKMLWCIGSIYTGSIGILFSVTYFDQMHVVWYFFLACIPAVTAVILKDDNKMTINTQVS